MHGCFKFLLVVFLLALVAWACAGPLGCRASPPETDEACRSRLELEAMRARGEDPEAPQRVLTREQGLALLRARVQQKPDADSEEEALAFLRFFKENKERWQVTRRDLVQIYREAQPNLFAQLGQLSLSRRATAPYGGVRAFLGD